MVSKKTSLRNLIVYNDNEITTMRKYLKEIMMVSNKGGFPQYEIGKLADVINYGGETMENYVGERDGN
jgi:hypothetical protein